MPSWLAEPNWVAHAQGAEATLGNTTANTKQEETKAKWQALFHKLPTELHINILAHLYEDPVSQMCFGLTSRYFHGVFHEVYDEVCEGKRRYKIRRYSFDLRMQVSICGKYVLHGWYEYWFLEDSKDISWERNLGQLLAGEKWLWGDLQHCEGCVRYKPKAAFERFAFEVKMATKYAREVEALEADDIDWYMNQCKRCRTKILLVIFGEGKEVFEKGNPMEERKSLGLRVLESGSKETGKNSTSLWDGRSKEDREASIDNYEPWEDVFTRLCI